jgi:CrcB protein
MGLTSETAGTPLTVPGQGQGDVMRSRRFPPRRRDHSEREDVVIPRGPIDPDRPPAGVGLEPSEDDVFRAGRPVRTVRRDRQLDVLAAIALGGGLGSVARYLISTAIPVRPGHFPWATFLINLGGCFALGLLMVFVIEIWPPRRYVRPFAGIGVLGGFTTFSTFAVEVRGLAAHGARALADAYTLNSLVAGVAAVWCGIALARLVAKRPVRRGRKGRSA